MLHPVGGETDLQQLCYDLIQLDHDAVGAYEEAIQRLTDPTGKARLDEFKSDHERHIQELSDALRRLGGTPPTEGDWKSLLTKGRVYLGSLSGDEAVLKAMKSNEDDTNAAYERAFQNEITNQDREIRQIVERGLADERRHRAWLTSQVG